MPTAIHPTALVDPAAQIGDNVEIGPFAVIGPDVVIGDNCVIGARVSVFPHTTLGADCRIHVGAVLGDDPQDRAFSPADTALHIGARCTIREYVTIHRGTKPGTSTDIGEDCFLMALSHMAHNVRLGNGVIVANATLLAGYVQVGDRAFISGNCVVHQFVHIGRLAMLGGAAAVSRDVPPFCTIRPHAENDVIGLNVVGLRRADLTTEQRSQIKKAFDTLYRSGLPTSQAVRRIREILPPGPAHEIADFVDASERGICRLHRDAQETNDSDL